MKKLFVSVLIALSLFGCSEKKTSSDPRELIDADVAFSDYSVKNGFHKAFIEFADDSVVLLKANRMPIVGKESLIGFYEGKSDSAVQLFWKPAKAVMAGSGELGYTYGFWTFVSAGDSTRGTYLTIWKKDASGNWKYVADTGNDGLGTK